MEQKNLFAEILTTVTKYLKLIVIIVVVGICLSGIRIVKSGDVALILRFGKLVGQTQEEQIHQSGLLLAFPYIIDEVIMVPTSTVMEQSVTTYYHGGGNGADHSYVITGDQNIAVMSASVKYMVTDPVAYALNVKDIPSVINACVSNAMLTQAARCDVEELLTTGKEAFIADVRQTASEKLDHAGVGITLSSLEMTQLTMPPEVQDIYQQVNAATVQAATSRENATNYYTRMIAYAEGVRTEAVAAATADGAARTAEAELALAEFWGLLEEYRQNPQVVKTRIYNAKVSQMMDAIKQIRVVEDGETKLFLNP